MPRYLIVNSDDFGISPGVNRGILEGHHNGIVTSTTTMTNMPAAADAIQAALASAPELGLGLHFNLSFGKPICTPEDVPSLVTPEGNFVSDYPELMQKMTTFDAGEVKRELSAQFLRFIELAGRPPDHVDSHHGVTYFQPAALATMLELAHEYHLPIRSFPHDRLRNADAQIADRMQAILDEYGLPRQPDRMLDPMFDFKNGDRLERLITGLRHVPEGYSEMLVHVGYAEGLQESYTTQREEELAAITDASVKELVESEGIQLITFADLP